MHELIIGKTGSGKSTLIENEIAVTQHGFTFLDPHGQSADRIADILPEVILWEPADPLCPLAINVLSGVPEPQHALVVEQTLSSIKSVHPDNWGPNLEDILRNALFLLIASDKSLVQLPAVLTDAEYRKRLLSSAFLNETVRDFWREEFQAKRFPAEEVRSTLNKVRIFALNPVLRRNLSRNSIDLKRVMDKGQRLVLNLSVSLLGEKPASLLGALVINSIYHAALSRSAIPEEKRMTHRLVVDEWQNFSTTTLGNILAEARKYRLYLTLLNQLTAQIDRTLMQTVLGNIGRLTVFKVGHEDAKILVGELGLRLPDVLVDLANFYYYQREGLALHREVPAAPPLPGRGYLLGNRANTRARYRRN